MVRQKVGWRGETFTRTELAFERSRAGGQPQLVATTPTSRLVRAPWPVSICLFQALACMLL